MDSLKTTPATDHTAQEEHRAATRVKSSTAHKPKSSQVSWCKSSVTINGKTHPLPTTKEYILHEYADVFRGVGTLPGGPYHIKLKDSYKPVQHPPRSVLLGMQSAYKAELDRLVKEGIITEVHEHTEWINSIVPVMKEDGSLRLCLDPKDLNKAIKRNQWYARTLDDILPELAQSKHFTLHLYCNIQILAHTFRLKKQSPDYIQHTMGQIQVAKDAICFKSLWGCFPRKTE